MNHDATPTIALLAAPEVTASSLFALYDMVWSAGRDWAMLTDGTTVPSRARAVITAASSATIEAANGVRITPQQTFDTCATPAVVYVPEIFVAPDEPITGRFDDAIGWLRRCHAQGAIIASACSGALLLAEAGLLDGQEATTHWAYCPELARRYPTIKVHPARCLVASGDGQRLITAGAGTSYMDLGLFLIARLFGQDEAMRLARIYLIDWHAHGQLPYATLACTRQAEDRAIARAQVWIAENYAHPAPVAAMMRMTGLSPSTFKRRFQHATGLSPLDYVQTLRLEEAKEWLETSDEPIDAVANAVGYEDASFFRRLFRRKIGLSPHDYRQRFGAFRKVLEATV